MHPAAGGQVKFDRFLTGIQNRRHHELRAHHELVFETVDFGIVRVVQEGMTNAFKHAGASVLDILVEPADPRDTPVAFREHSRPVVRVAVSDDGKGLSEEMKPSYGVAGMSERVWAMGGEIKLTNRAGGGVTLEAWIPVPAGAKA